MSAQEAEYQMSIIEDKANPQVERRELKIEIASKSTPKRDALRKAVATSLKVPIERVFVKSTLSSYGTNISVCKVHVYENDERGKAIEPNYVQLRNLSREERKNTINAQLAAKAAASKPGEEKAETGTKVK
jgi:ribosomal protein S24E